MDNSLTIKELSQLTGVNSRTLQFWTMSGVIDCDPETRHEGPGKPRRYSQDEAVVALVLSEIIRMPLQVGALREIADRFREIMNYGPEHGVTDPVHWETSDDGDIMMQEARRLEKERKHFEASQLRDKYYGLRDWSALQLSIRGVRSVVIPDYKRVPVSEQVLALAVDDTGSWQLSIDHLSHRKDSHVPEEGPPVWSLRLLLNLTRTFTRLHPRVIPNHAAATEADDEPTRTTDDE